MRAEQPSEPDAYRKGFLAGANMVLGLWARKLSAQAGGDASRSTTADACRPCPLQIVRSHGRFEHPSRYVTVLRRRTP